MRFSLKTFLIFVTALAIAVGLEVNRAARQREASSLLASYFAKVNVKQRAWPLIITSRIPGFDSWLRKHLGDEYLDTIVGVNLDIGSIDNVDLQAIALQPGLSSINAIRIDSQYITNSGVAHLKAFRKLKTLRLINVKVDDEGLAFLSHLPNLERFQVPQRVRGRGLRHLANPGRLLSLDMAAAWVVGDSLAPLENCLNLRWLDLQNTRADDSSLRHLQDLSQLQYLNIDETRTTDAGLQYLAGLVSLTHLSLNEIDLTDDGMEYLNGLENLKTISLAGAAVSDAGLEHLTELRHLKAVYFDSRRHNGRAPPLPRFMAKRRDVLVVPLRSMRSWPVARPPLWQ